jgi:hypothetical protein
MGSNRNPDAGSARRGAAGRLAKTAGVGLVVAALLWAGGEAHRTIISKYTYNQDVYPIFLKHCSGCHAGGSAAPMSLLIYRDALPWAEAIREELTHERMPPWYADPSSQPGRSRLTARELDTLLVWATGGAPEGVAAPQPSHPGPGNDWPLGPPDLLIPIAGYSMPEDQQEFVYEVTVPTGLAETRWLKAVDLRPGNPALVRSGAIALDSPAGPQTLLSLWQPGDLPPAAPVGTAFRLPADSKLRVQIRYRRPWQLQMALMDQSSVGLYFVAQPPTGRALQSFSLKAVSSDTPQSRRYSGQVVDSLRVMGWVPLLDRLYESVELNAVLPGETSVRLFRLSRPRPEWNRRYWLAQPLDLPPGARLEVITVEDTLGSDLASRLVGDAPSLEFRVDHVAP